MTMSKTLLPQIHRRALLSVTLLALLVGLTLPTLAVSADSVVWRGEYYNNVTLSGTPVLVRDDSSINFAWEQASPGTGVNADDFSVRWSTFTWFSAGDYTFSLTLDDGGRLWVDEQLIIDEWRDQSKKAFSATKYLSAGYHSLRLEYYDSGLDATCQLTWTGGTTISDWRGEYYNNTWLGSTAALVRNDTAINFEWANGSPASGVNADQFSARWTRTVSFASAGTYTFSATADDGVRVWVDGSLLIDKWYAQSRTTHAAEKYLAAGDHQIKVEYFEESGTAVCIFSWTKGTSPSTSSQVIVDDTDSGFISGGNASSFYPRATGYGAHLYWTWNSSSQVYNWGKWYPNLPASGNWQVYVYIPSRYHGTKNATYSIHHEGYTETKAVNQSAYNNQWVSLGTYHFAGGASEYVYLTDVTGETYATRFVGFDAVKFVLRSEPGAPPPPSGCNITPVLGFGRIWNDYSSVRNALGCPTENERQTWAGEQSFQGGYMFWRQDADALYVLYSNGTWQVYDDTWSEGDTEWDVSIVPPSGYYQPKRGFGKVWRDQAGVRDGLGWAVTEERGFIGSVQTFDGGIMFWSNTRGILVLKNDSTWAQFN